MKSVQLLLSQATLQHSPTDTLMGAIAVITNPTLILHKTKAACSMTCCPKPPTFFNNLQSHQTTLTNPNKPLLKRTALLVPRRSLCSSNQEYSIYLKGSILFVGSPPSLRYIGYSRNELLGLARDPKALRFRVLQLSHFTREPGRGAKTLDLFGAMDFVPRVSGLMAWVDL